MALSVGAQRTTLLERARDPNGTANTSALIWDLFNRLQMAVNAEIEDVVESAPLNLNSRQCVYGINATIPAAQKVLGVRDENGRDLYPMQFEQLRGLDRRWFRHFKDSLRWFSLCGYDLLIVGPPLDGVHLTGSPTVLYNKVTPAITADTSTFTLQDENVQPVMELAEAILLAKARDWAGAQQALERAVKTMKLDRVALRKLMPLKPTTDGM